MSHHHNIGSSGTPLGGLALGLWLLSDLQQRHGTPWGLFLLLLIIIFIAVFIWTRRGGWEKLGRGAAAPVSLETSPAAAAPIEVPLAAAPAPAVEVAERSAEAPPAEVKPDDLKIIEGIGPKISALLVSHGIRTFRELADADVEHLRGILRGARLSALADPATWPRQARLAADGDWQRLQALQDQLKGGREA
jgi:predicted flap endonuclease-1-like 5' DNA nuclease